VFLCSGFDLQWRTGLCNSRGGKVCLSVLTSDLGPAHAGLDTEHHLLVFSPALTSSERVLLARRALAAAGQKQPPEQGNVLCLCGSDLDVLQPDPDAACSLAAPREACDRRPREILRTFRTMRKERRQLMLTAIAFAGCGIPRNWRSRLCSAMSRICGPAPAANRQPASGSILQHPRAGTWTLSRSGTGAGFVLWRPASRAT
jgi:hypothetical protein